jgi:hypothetical protein
MKLEKATDGKHKYVAVFNDGKRVAFGAFGYNDFTKTGDKEARKRYLARHKANEDWNNPKTAGALSKALLWGDSRSVNDNLRAFKRRFNID